MTRLLAKPGEMIQRGQPLFVVEATDMVQAQNDFIAAITVMNKALLKGKGSPAVFRAKVPFSVVLSLTALKRIGVVRSNARQKPPRENGTDEFARSLRTAFHALERAAAPGVDGMTWEIYEDGSRGSVSIR